jgi:dTDP-4-amino-4,6-dideoxygalactose transaminase
MTSIYDITAEFERRLCDYTGAPYAVTVDNQSKGAMQCLSFTGPYKHLKLGKAGAILTDNHAAYLWLKRARFSGRRECSYHDDSFDMLGWNFYLLPEIAAKGVRDIQQFYNIDGTPKEMPDITLPYPDLSTFPIYTK